MTLEFVLTVLAVLILLKGIVGVFDAVRYLRYIRQHLAVRPIPWMPRVSVILPCKGLEPDLEKNAEAVFRQVYPFFEVLVVTAREGDPARALLARLANQFPGQRIRLITAGFSEERGEKVHNLIQAVASTDPTSEVLAFTDSDSRPHLLWLQELVAPLQDEQIGIATGYRWYYPDQGNLAGMIRSVWNGSVAGLLGNHSRNFAWGGSMAIRRSVFDSANVLRYWQHSVSDDYSMTRAIKDAGLRVHYEPRCLIGSYGRCSWRELLEWSTRQMMVTKIYSRRLWRLALVSQWSFVLVWWWCVGGFILASFPVRAGALRSFVWSGSVEKYWILAGLMLLFGAVRGWYRVRTIQRIRPEHADRIQRAAWGHVLLFPLASTLTAYNLFCSALSSALEWRGVRYEFSSDGQLRVIRRSE